MVKPHIINKRMQKVFGLPDEPTPVLQTLHNPLAATRCKLEVPLNAMTNPMPREDAYMMVMQIRGKNSRELWLDGKPVKTEPLYEGGIVFHDLRQNPRFHFYDPLDSVNYFLLRKTLDAIADGEDASRISGLKFTPGVGIKDEVVEQLTRLLLPAFDSPKRVSRLFADYVSLALGSHVARTYGGMKITVAPERGGLAAWQERRAKELLGANLGGNITTADIARECALSTGHFTRAFRRSTGMSPHQWLLRRRVDLAHDLLRDARLSLADIARACGFADQSHFTKVYTRLRDIGPGAWRRQHGILSQS